MYRICKQFSFEAAHSLNKLHEGHKCRNVHGHSYKVDVVFVSEMLDQAGMVRDLGSLEDIQVYIRQTFDHNIINNVIYQPTVENIARHLFDWCLGRWSNVESVRVYETATSWGEYSR